MRRTFHLAIATLVLTSFTAAQADISLPTIVPVPIPAGTLITDGGGATLDNFVSQDLFVNTTSDWTTAALLIQLDSGSIFQEPEEGFPMNGSTLGQPNPAAFGLLPSSEFDSYIFDPHGGGGISGTAGGDVGGDIFQFDTLELDVTWISPGADTADVGGSTISRVTLSGDAQGRWSFAYTQAQSPIVRVVYNPIVNGQMVLSPLRGDLNFDGFVGIEDLNVVLGRWNQNTEPGLPYDPSRRRFRRHRRPRPHPGELEHRVPADTTADTRSVGARLQRRRVRRPRR